MNIRIATLVVFWALMVGVSPAAVSAEFFRVIYEVQGDGSSAQDLEFKNFLYEVRGQQFEDGLPFAPEHALSKMTAARELEGVDCFLILPAKVGASTAESFVIANQSKGNGDKGFVVPHSSNLATLEVTLKRNFHVENVSYTDKDGKSETADRVNLNAIELREEEQNPEHFCTIRYNGQHRHEHEEWPDLSCEGDDKKVCAWLNIQHGNFKHCNIGGNRVVHCG